MLRRRKGGDRMEDGGGSYRNVLEKEKALTAS